MKKNQFIPPSLEKEEQLIIDYLNQIENWGRFELSLFTNCLFIFDSEYIYTVYHRVIKKMKIYSKHPYYKDNLLVFLKNSLIIFWQRNDFPMMKRMIDELDILTQEFVYANERFTYLIFQKAYTHRENFDISLIETELKMLEYLGYHTYSKQVKELFQN